MTSRRSMKEIESIKSTTSIGITEEHNKQEQEHGNSTGGVSHSHPSTCTY
jgi:hypothetical protein